MRSSETFTICAVLAAGLLGQGCAKKKVAAAVPPAPQSAPAPARASAAPAPTSANTAPRPEPVAAVTRSRTPDAATRKRIDELLAHIEDAYFDYNRHSLRPDAIRTLQGDSAELRDILKGYPDYILTVEGYCDERGSAEYNLALGNERAQAAKDYLVQVGIPDGQLLVKSYGKEKQVCDEHDEACWQRNRRIHIVAAAR